MIPKAWSYSALTNFENCPKNYYLMRVEKAFPQEESEVLVSGKEIHMYLDKRMSKKQPLPLHLRHLEDICLTFEAKKSEVSTEVQIAINRDFKQVGYFADDVWGRVVIDLALIKLPSGVVIDWKTGSRITDDFTQLEVASVVLMLMEIGLEKVNYGYVYTQLGRTVSGSILRQESDRVWSELLPRIERFESAFNTGEFPARPSWLCRASCPVRSCPHHPDA
jgi:hypothetical protein